jgi:hypothetical protein
MAAIAAVGAREAVGERGSMATVRMPQSSCAATPLPPSPSGRATHTSPRPVTISCSAYDCVPQCARLADEEKSFPDPPALAGPPPPPGDWRPEYAACCVEPPACGDRGALPCKLCAARPGGVAAATRAPPDHKPSSTSTCSGLRGMAGPTALAASPRELR